MKAKRILKWPLLLIICLLFLAEVSALAQDLTKPAPPDTSENENPVLDLEKRIDIVDEDLYQRHRLLERRVEELEERLQEDVAKRQYKSEWAEKIKLSGDLRLRYQGDFFGEDNADFVEPDDTSQLMNTDKDRHRFRYRARLDINAALLDPRSQNVNVGKTEVGVRLSTGSDSDPVSTNETMGDYFNKDTLVVDRAYLKWTYRPVDEVMGRIPEFWISAGRMANPWLYTNLVWDDDVNFEGMAVSFDTDTLMFHSWSAFLTAGIFPLQENEFTLRDKWFRAVQAGVDIRPDSRFNLKIGFAYYGYDNITGSVNEPSKPGENDYTAPIYQQKGNTLMDIDPSTDIVTALAADYELVNVTAKLTLGYFFPVQIVLFADYVENIGFDKDEVAKRTGNDNVKEENQGQQFGGLVGYPNIREFGEWNVYGYYRYLEADAVLDAFTDSDFHGGGTNCRGWAAGFGFGLFKNIWLGVKWMTSDEIEGPPMAWDTVQVDINAKF